MNLTTLGQGAKVIELILQKEITAEQMQNLLESGRLADLLEVNVGSVSREDFRKFLGLNKLMPDIMELAGVVLPELFVTYGDRIAAGGYDWKDNTITEQRFPLTLAAGPRALVMVHFNTMMTSPEVEVWAAENGYEVALFDDLLAVGSHSQYKELQLQFPIIQLGSFAEVYSNRDVPSLRRRDAGRYLCLGWCGGSWSEGCRFLLVRKS